MESKPYYFLSIIISIYTVCAIIFRISVPLGGDGMYIVKNFSDALNGVLPLDLRNEPLATVYFFGIVKLLSISTYEGLLNAFLVASIILGISFIVTIYFICLNLFEKQSDKLLSFLFLMSFPYIQLFFGYVETYGAVILSVTIYILSIVLFMRGKLSFSSVITIFIIMGLSHYISVMLFPSLLYIGFLEYKKNGIKGIGKGITVFTSIILIILLMINFDLQNYYAWTPHSHLLSLTTDEDALSLYTEPYTLFSTIHGSELLNYFILLGAASLTIIISVGVKNHRMLWDSSIGKFFLTAVIPIILTIAILKFDLGLAKDWDVMAAYFPIVALFAAWLMMQLNTENIYRSFGLIIMITMLNSTLFFVVHARTDSSLQRYQELFNPQTVSNYGYYSSTLSLALYFHQIGEVQSPIDAWNRYSNNYPNDPQGYQNLITNLKNVGMRGIPYSLNAFEKWISTIPSDTTALVEYITYCIDAGNLLFGQGEFKGAEAVYKRAITLAPGYERSYNNLGSVYAQINQTDSALAYFQKAIKLNPNYSDPYYNIANIEETRGNKQKARELFQKAANLQNPSAIEKLKTLGLKK
jgi:tetratricopeptide (TPR) repeat protein